MTNNNSHKIMKNLKILAAFLSLTLFSLVAQAVVVMQPLTTFGPNGDGSVRPGDLFFLTSSNQWQRGMAYNPTTGHLLVVDRSTNTTTSASGDVYIIDGNTGAAVTNSSGLPKKLDISSIIDLGNVAFRMSLIGIADDGAIYVGNLSTATTPPQYALYRWENEDAPQTLVFPTQSFPDSDPSSGNTNVTERRWGDTMAVRGSGLTTQILIANRGTNAALFTPDDNTYSHFTPKTLGTDAQPGGLSVGLTFGTANTFWTTPGSFGNGALRLMAYNTTAGTATTTSIFTSPEWPGAISPILAIPSKNLFAGITMVSGADVVRLYSTPNAAASPSVVLQDRKSFVTTHPNNNYAGALALGTNEVLYALDSDNGIMAFTLTTVASNPLPPSFFLNPSSQSLLLGTNVTFTSAADGDSPITYQWYFGANIISGATNTSLVLSNIQLTNAGNYRLVASNPINVATSAVAVLTVTTSSPNSLLVYDSFPYAVGSPLVTNSTTGQGTWVMQTDGQVPGTNVAGNLNVPGLAASISNHLFWGSATVGMRSVIAQTAISTGSIYFSFAYMLEPDSTVPAAGAGADTVAALAQTTATATYSFKVNVHTNSTGPGYNVGCFKFGGENYGAYATNVVALGETIFVVGRYTFNEAAPAGDDTIALWINPNPSTFGGSSAPTPSVGDGGIVAISGTQPTTTELSIARFAFRQSGGPSLSHADEVRVGRTWADVTPPVAVAAPTITIVANGNGTVTMSWPTAATGYNLEGTPSLTTPITWNPVTNSVIIVGTNNTVTVNANSGNQFFRLKK